MPDRGAGQLFEKVAFDERTISSDGHGNEEGDFAEQFTCRAGYTYLRGGETVIASRLVGRQPVVVRVRASSNTRQIQPDWRMRDLRSGQSYAVRSVVVVDGRQFLDVLVESGVAP
ncbi:head-tail adaptor protein [Sinorhizobium medicae]|nr:head-tail adaptor protein [Sinorhizobium medicae]